MIKVDKMLLFVQEYNFLLFNYHNSDTIKFFNDKINTVALLGRTVEVLAFIILLK